MRGEWIQKLPVGVFFESWICGSFNFHCINSLEFCLQGGELGAG